MPKKLTAYLLMLVFACSILTASSRNLTASAWSNGGYSNDPTQPDYGTHDWIAQHALDWLPLAEKQFLNNYLSSYLYGTELPDNRGAEDGLGDTTKHHIYFYANGSVQDDSSAVRARVEYQNAKRSFAAGNFSAAAEELGMVAHYVSDVAVFGHVMGASTAWGSENHHSDYEDYVLAKTASYSSEFSAFLVFDQTLNLTSPYDATVTVARDTTFDKGQALTCTWMDQHYNWSDPQFRNRVGESLNLAANTVADVMHSFYAETEGPAISPAATPTPMATPQAPELPTLSAVVALVLTVSLLAVGLKGKKPLKKAFQKALQEKPRNTNAF